MISLLVLLKFCLIQSDCTFTKHDSIYYSKHTKVVLDKRLLTLIYISEEIILVYNHFYIIVQIKCEGIIFEPILEKLTEKITYVVVKHTFLLIQKDIEVQPTSRGDSL